MIETLPFLAIVAGFLAVQGDAIYALAAALGQRITDLGARLDAIDRRLETLQDSVADLRVRLGALEGH